MQSFMSSFTHWRTTIPGVGLALVAIGHYWLTGNFDMNDMTALVGSIGLIGVQKPA